MSDPYVGESPVCLGVPEGVGQAEIGVADHPEHGVDPPVRHDVDHLVHEGDAPLDHRKPDVEPVIPFFHRERTGGVGESRRRLARRGVVLVPVPRAQQVSRIGIDLAFAERAALMRAAIVEGSPA